MSCLTGVTSVYSAKGLDPSLETELSGETSVECGILLAEIISGTLTVELSTTEGTGLGFYPDKFPTGIGAWDTDPMWVDYSLSRCSFTTTDTLYIEFSSSAEPTSGNLYVRFPGMTTPVWIAIPNTTGDYTLADQGDVRTYFLAENGNNIPVELTFKQSEAT